MEELFSNYKQSVFDGLLTSDLNDKFIRLFIDKVTALSIDIREKCYIELLRNLMIFECTEYKRTKDSHLIHALIICMTTVCKYNGITISNRKFAELKKNFVGEKAKLVVNEIESIVTPDKPYVSRNLMIYLNNDEGKANELLKEWNKKDKLTINQVINAFVQVKPLISKKGETLTFLANELTESSRIKIRKQDINSNKAWKEYKKSL